MTTHSKLESPFLAAIDAKVSRKRVRHMGQLETEFSMYDGVEMLLYMFESATGPYVVVDIAASNFASVLLRSAKKENRGKILLRLEDMRVLNNERRIGQAVVATFKVADYSAGSHEAVATLWRDLGIRLVE